MLAAVVSLAACGGPTEFVRRPERPLRWPGGDEPPRIEYVLAYGGSDDVRRSRGFWGSLVDLLAGPEEHHLVTPGGLALGADEVLWIADPGLGAVHRVSLVTGEHRICGTEGELRVVLPVGVTVGAQERIYVTDSAQGRIFVLSGDGAVVGSLGGPEQLGRPTGIAWDAAGGRLLVLDTTGCRLIALDLEGRVLAVAGTRGDGPGEFNYPTHLAVGRQGQVAVVDSLNFRVQILAADLRPLSTFGEVGRGPGNFASPKGVGLDSDGHVYVVDAMFGNVQIFNPDGRLLLVFGANGTALGELSLPTGLHIDARDRIHVADAGNGRVQVFQYLRRQP